MLDFLDGIYQYQANTSTSRNTTQSTTRSTTVSTSSTVDTSSNTTISTTASTTRSTTTTFNTTFSTSYSTSFSTSFSTSYSTSIPVTREPSSGWYHNGGNGSGTYYWDAGIGSYVVWAGTVKIDIYTTPAVPSTATSGVGYDGYTYLRGPLTNSDIALKTDIAPARNYLDTVNGIPVHTFKYKTNVEDDPILGVMAQEVEAVAPELMTKKANGVKAVYPQQIQYAMLKAIQELTSKVEDLENKIKSM